MAIFCYNRIVTIPILKNRPLLNNIKISKQSVLPSKFGEFQIQVFAQDDKEHLVIFTKELGDTPLLRMHSECLTGDAIGSLKCDCGDQLEYALKMIDRENGMLIYLRQEGRGIGLLNKINAYALQDNGLNTIEANHQLGFKTDERTYEIAEFILEYYQIKKIRLLTNNPAKLSALKDVQIIEQIPIIMESNSHNKEYLKIKKDDLGHLL